MKANKNQGPDAGLYVLVCCLASPVRLQVGKKGRFSLASGLYLYVGSAQKNRFKRIARHRKHNKPKHWHIDFLTSHPKAAALDAFLVPGKKPRECRLNQDLGKLGILESAIPGFGASDCGSGCASHLWYAGRMSRARLKKELGQVLAGLRIS